jgi:hypothetical protein
MSKCTYTSGIFVTVIFTLFRLFVHLLVSLGARVWQSLILGNSKKSLEALIPIDFESRSLFTIDLERLRTLWCRGIVPQVPNLSVIS